LAFTIRKTQKKELSLVSFMDMIFILLIFYLVTCISASLGKEEKKIVLPTPKNEAGRADVLIQWVGNDKIIWIEKSMAAELRTMRYGIYETNDPDEIDRILIQRIVQRHSMNLQQAIRFMDTESRAFNQGSRNFIVVRCPDTVPYSDVMQMISALHDKGVRYGCIGGDVDALKVRVSADASQIDILFGAG
jgi:biopolymer transport protein ExbD